MISAPELLLGKKTNQVTPQGAPGNGNPGRIGGNTYIWSPAHSMSIEGLPKQTLAI
jgi:hypothetical protein